MSGIRGLHSFPRTACSIKFFLAQPFTYKGGNKSDRFHSENHRIHIHGDPSCRNDQPDQPAATDAMVRNGAARKPPPDAMDRGRRSSCLPHIRIFNRRRLQTHAEQKKIPASSSVLRNHFGIAFRYAVGMDLSRASIQLFFTHKPFEYFLHLYIKRCRNHPP